MRFTKIFLIVCSLSLIASLASAQDFTQANTDLISIGTYDAGTGTPTPTPGPSNGNSTNPRMSKNGRFVVFESTAGNLVAEASIDGNVIFPSVTPGRSHIYLYDRQADRLELISVTRQDKDDTLNTADDNRIYEISQDAHDPAVSNDGRYVAYTSRADISEFQMYPCFGDGCHVHKFYAGEHVWVRDRYANETFLASQASIPSKVQQITEGERVVEDVKVCITPITTPCNFEDANTYITEKAPVMEVVTKRISAAMLDQITDMPTPTPGALVSSHPRLSGDGRFIAFDSNAENLDEFGSQEEPIIDPHVRVTDYDPNDGLLSWYYVQPARAIYADNNGVRDIFVRDGQDFTTKRVNLGCQFHAPGGCDVEGQLDSGDPSISDDASIIAFSTAWPFLDWDLNMVSDVYVIERDLMNGEVANLKRISNDTGRILAANGASTSPAVSGDGRFIAYQSAATNIVNGDTNGKTDIFVYDRDFFRTIRCSDDDLSGAGDSTVPDISGSGEYVSFQSTSTNFGASSGHSNAYVAEISRDAYGRLTSCEIVLASYGTGDGADNTCSNVSVGVVSTSATVAGESVRVRAPAVAYQCLATNLTETTDSNGVSDIFQAPTCDDISVDTDSDGTPDCFDQCWEDPLKVTDVDTDGDGIADCEDGCPNNPQKPSPGECGCDVLDNDADLDDHYDCNDACPNDANKWESAGECGCGFPDTDSDADGVPDCNEVNTVPTPEAVATATPVFEDVTPRAATLTKTSRSSLRVRLYSSNFTRPVKSYRVHLYKTGSNRVKRYTKTTNLFTITKRGAGRYKVKYEALSTDDKWSQLSAFSNTIKLP